MENLNKLLDKAYQQGYYDAKEEWFEHGISDGTIRAYISINELFVKLIKENTIDEYKHGVYKVLDYLKDHYPVIQEYVRKL